MGIGTKIADSRVASKVANGMGVDQAKSALHRKYVWYDFSVGLEKAMIKILQCENLIAQNIEKTPFNLVCALSVQINPSEFRSDYAMNIRNVESGLQSKQSKDQPSTPSVTFDSSNSYSSLEIPLIYDIYDEFMARTANESFPTNSISLSDEKVTSLPMLARYAKSGIYYVKVVWGDINRFGLLRGIDINYTAFSRWGQPLKANANLHIAEQPLTDSSLPKINGDIQSLTSTGKKVAGNVAAGVKNIFR